VPGDGTTGERRGPARTSRRFSRNTLAVRVPSLLETSVPGVFVAGDVRAGSVKRVASAVGEGAMAVMYVHQYLRDT
jgi:thioredoxin reductase (NADPH)